MAIPKKYQIFVSSTFRDLEQERLGVLETIHRMGCIAAGMEQFPASHRDAWSQIKRTIDESDYYIVLIGTLRETKGAYALGSRG